MIHRNTARANHLRHWALLLALVLWALPACTEEVTYGTAEQAIVNGTREPEAVSLTEGEILAIGWLFQPGAVQDAFCTGTLIGPNVVATASHCVFRNDPEDVRFGFGLEPSAPDATYAVTDIWEHPILDAALLVLEEDVSEALPEIEPIRPNSEAPQEDQIGTQFQAGGYGATRDPSRTGRWFATVYLNQITDTLVIVDGRGDQGICFGDSGGPLIGLSEEGYPVLVGVESGGDATCVDIDRLTRVDVFYDWALPVLEGGAPEGHCGDLDARGRCEGNVLEWCHEAALRQRDCEAEGLVCGYHERVGHTCVTPTTEPDQDAGTIDVGGSGDLGADVVVQPGARVAGDGEEGCATIGGGGGSEDQWWVVVFGVLAIALSRRMRGRHTHSRSPAASRPPVGRG